MKFRIVKLFGLSVTLAFLAVVVVNTSDIGVAKAGFAADTIRWDIVSVTDESAILSGGAAYALADDNTVIKLTGSGTFGLGLLDPVTGGGNWTEYDTNGNITAEGTYEVTGLISFEQAPGTFPESAPDQIGNTSDARAGVAYLRVLFSDGSRGVVVISCRLPVDSPTSIFGGITVSKGFVTYWNRSQAVPGLDANRTLFHSVP